MVSVILRSAGTRAAVDYNEKKTFEGNAFVVGYNLFRNANPYEIYETFDRYESNPAIPAQARRKNFHMALSPDRGDEIYGDDERAVELLMEIMDRMGFGEQPYVIYRHDDIDRTHYHIVSTRVRKDGSVINMWRDRMRMLGILNELKEKYGYTVGRDESAAIAVGMTSGKIRPEAENKVRSILDSFDEALKYNFTSLAQFQTVMSEMGVCVKSREWYGNRTMWFAVQDGNGRVASLGFNAERDLGVDAYRRFERRLEENEEMSPDPKVLVKMREAFLFCAERARSWAGFRRMMSECGLAFVGQEKAGRMVTYSVVDRDSRCILTAQRLGTSCDVSVLNAKGWLLEEDEVNKDRLLTAEDFAVIRRCVIEGLRRAGYIVTDGAEDEEREKRRKLDVAAKPAVKRSTKLR